MDPREVAGAEPGDVDMETVKAIEAAEIRDREHADAYSEPAARRETAPRNRRLVEIDLNSVTPRPVNWVWEGRLPVGGLCLLGGREGIGKSIVAVELVARITRGELPGVWVRQPRHVIIVATEDSIESTIVPCLMAAGAGLDLVTCLEVEDVDGYNTSAVSLPADLAELEEVIKRRGTGVIIFDPLVSRLGANLDTHKDAEVRLALEPLVRVADRTKALFLGLIHVNKGSSADPLTMLTGSRAFAAVCRAVLFMVADPDDSEKKLLGQAKNSLGRMDLPTLALHIVGEKVASHAEGPVTAGKLVWDADSEVSIQDAVSNTDPDEVRSAVAEAADWLRDRLADGPVDRTARQRCESGGAQPDAPRTRPEASWGGSDVIQR